MMQNNDTQFKQSIAPFFWVEHDEYVSVCLNAGEYMSDIFQTREDEGFEGNGYDWGSLAKIFLQEKMPELQGVIRFDPEGGMFCAYSSDADALKTFVTAFKHACERHDIICDLFSRAELD